MNSKSETHSQAPTHHSNDTCDYVYPAKYDFHGGVHPNEHKTLSNKRVIETLKTPAKVSIPLNQHSGAQAKPVVSVGDTIINGQLIGAAQDKVSANVHSPISGIVTALEEKAVAHPSGMNDMCIVVESNHDHTQSWMPEIKHPFECDRQQLIERIFQAGVVGLGGASFPTHVKLAKPIETLIINAAECEPYITCDDRLLQEEAATLIEAFQLIQYILSATRCVIAIEDNKPLAISALQSQLLKEHKIELCILPTKYPSGGEKQLIELVTGIQVPSGKLPASLGITTQNVATCYAIRDAIIKGKPIVDRVITLTGDGCKQPGNYRIPIGTPIDTLVDAFAKPELEYIIMGGPMMGFKIIDTSAAVIKSTNCLIFKAHSKEQTEKSVLPCIRCGQCADACPVSLLPQQLYWFSRSSEFEKAQDYNLADCIECGACSYVCPSNIPLVDYYRFAKSEIKQQQQDKQNSDIAKQRFEFRQQRLERDKAERKLRHKQAAEERKAAALKNKEADEKKATIAAAVARAKARQKNKT